MIYRFYKSFEPYTSEAIQKEIHANNINYPQFFIFSNYYEKVSHNRVKAFLNADEVLEFERDENFVHWIYPESPTVVKRNIDGLNTPLYVFYVDCESYFCDSEISWRFNEFIEKFPDESIISYGDYTALLAKYAPTIDPLINDRVLVEKIAESVVAWDNECAGVNDINIPLPKNTHIFELRNVIVVEEKNKSLYVSGAYLTDKLERALLWFPNAYEDAGNYMTVHYPGRNYRILPKMTIHILPNEISTDEIVENIEKLKSYDNI